MNFSVTMQQAGQSKKMAEARLSFEERKTIFTFLKMCIHFFWHPLYISILTNICFIPVHTFSHFLIYIISYNFELFMYTL